MFESEALKETTERLVALRKAVKPFHDIAIGTSGRIPTERLSAHDWHELWKAYEMPPPRGMCDQESEAKNNAKAYLERFDADEDYAYLRIIRALLVA